MCLKEIIQQKWVYQRRSNIELMSTFTEIYYPRLYVEDQFFVGKS